MKQTTYIMVKPHFANYDSVISLVKEKIHELGLEIQDEAFIKYSVSDAQKHYREHFRGSYENAKGFYKELEDYITSDKAYGMVVYGEEAITTMRSAIKEIRKIVPNMLNEEPRMTENVIHGSDCEEAVINEVGIFNTLKTKKINNSRR